MFKAILYQFTLFRIKFLPVMERMLFISIGKLKTEKESLILPFSEVCGTYLIKSYCYKCGIFHERNRIAACHYTRNNKDNETKAVEVESCIGF